MGLQPPAYIQMNCTLTKRKKISSLFLFILVHSCTKEGLLCYGDVESTCFPAPGLMHLSSTQEGLIAICSER